MAEQKHKQTAKNEQQEVDELPQAEKNEINVDGILDEIDTVLEENTAEVDDFLDEIDSVLEQNAEAFVNSFVQKGGQ